MPRSRLLLSSKNAFSFLTQIQPIRNRYALRGSDSDTKNSPFALNTCWSYGINIKNIRPYPTMTPSCYVSLCPRYFFHLHESLASEKPNLPQNKINLLRAIKSSMQPETANCNAKLYEYYTENRCNEVLARRCRHTKTAQKAQADQPIQNICVRDCVICGLFDSFVFVTTSVLRTWLPHNFASSHLYTRQRK